LPTIPSINRQPMAKVTETAAVFLCSPKAVCLFEQILRRYGTEGKMGSPPKNMLNDGGVCPRYGRSDNLIYCHGHCAFVRA